MISHLIFDDQFLCRIRDKLPEHDYNFPLRGTLEDSQYRLSRLKAQKFVSAIEKVLKLHNGPISKFSLRFPKDCDAQIISDHIGQWKSLFSKKGFKQLILETPDAAKITTLDFSALESPTQLRLKRFWFGFRLTFGEFACLTDLELFQVSSFEQKHLQLSCS